MRTANARLRTAKGRLCTAKLWLSAVKGQLWVVEGRLDVVEMKLRREAASKKVARGETSGSDENTIRASKMRQTERVRSAGIFARLSAKRERA